MQQMDAKGFVAGAMQPAEETGQGPSSICVCVWRERWRQKGTAEAGGQTSTTKATTTTAAETTTEETTTTTEVRSTMTTGVNTTTAETTIATTKVTEKTTTQDVTAETTNTADGPPTGPTTEDPGFPHPWLYWAVPTVVVVLLVALAVLAYLLHRRRRRANRQKDDVEAHPGSDPTQSGSAKSEGKTTKTERSKTLKKAVVIEEYDEIEGVKKGDTKDGGHKQVESGPSHYLTQSAVKSEDSGKKEDETTVKAPPQKGISVPSSSSISEAAEKKKKSTTSNGYEKMDSTLLEAAGIGKKEEAKNDEYEKLPDLDDDVVGV